MLYDPAAAVFSFKGNSHSAVSPVIFRQESEDTAVRAGQIAKSGRCSCMFDLRRLMLIENHAHVDLRLSNSAIKKELLMLIATSPKT